MNDIPHRLIHYAPDREAVNHRRGTLTIDQPGTVTLRWGGFTLVTKCPPSAANTAPKGETRARQRVPDALLLSHLPAPADAADVVPAGWHGIPVLSAPTMVDILDRHGCSAIHALSTWERIVLRKGDASLAITAMPAMHQTDVAGSGVMGAMLELRQEPADEPFRIYLSAGSISIAELADIPLRFPEIHLAAFYLGAPALPGMGTTTDERHGREMIDITQPRRILFVPHAQPAECDPPMERLQADLDQLSLGHLVSRPGVGGVCRFTLTRAHTSLHRMSLDPIWSAPGGLVEWTKDGYRHGGFAPPVSQLEQPTG
jgi:hypothetical protein